VEKFTEKLIKNLVCTDFVVHIHNEEDGGMIITTEKGEAFMQTYLPPEKAHSCIMDVNMADVISNKIMKIWEKEGQK